VRDPELAERDDAADRLCVLSLVHFLWLEARAIRIGLAATGQWRLQRRASRGDDAPIEAGDRDLVAGLRDGVLRLFVERRIHLLQEIIRGGRRLDVGAVIDEIADRHPRCQLGHSAEVVAMPVGGDQVIDLREAGVLDGGHDAIGVPGSRRARIPGIDQYRPAGRRHEQRGVSTLDVHDVDVESFRGRLAVLRGGTDDRQRQNDEPTD
jgi:hypothetical protein